MREHPTGRRFREIDALRMVLATRDAADGVLDETQRALVDALAALDDEALRTRRYTTEEIDAVSELVSARFACDGFVAGLAIDLVTGVRRARASRRDGRGGRVDHEAAIAAAALAWERPGEPSAVARRHSPLPRGEGAG